MECDKESVVCVPVDSLSEQDKNSAPVDRQERRGTSDMCHNIGKENPLSLDFFLAL